MVRCGIAVLYLEEEPEDGLMADEVEVDSGVGLFCFLAAAEMPCMDSEGQVKSAGTCW